MSSNKLVIGCIGILLLLIGLLILWSRDRHVTERSGSHARAYSVAATAGTRRLQDAPPA